MIDLIFGKRHLTSWLIKDADTVVQFNMDKITQLNRCRFIDFFLDFIGDFELGNSLRSVLRQCFAVINQ
jgi:hypothetical protein